MRHYLSLAVALLAITATALPSFGQNKLDNCLTPREVLRLREGWHFTREDQKAFSKPQYDDSKWSQVVVPHDWAIYGPYSPEIDKQFLAISQDGQNTPIYHIARTGGLPHVGVGWYRNTFALKEGYQSSDRTYLRIDGAMSNARVYINGKEAIYWPYGYSPFQVDITNYIDPAQKYASPQ